MGGGTIFVIFCAIMGVKQYKRDIAKQKELKKEDSKPDEPEYTTVTMRATVVDQTCCVKMVGIVIGITALIRSYLSKIWYMCTR